MYVRINKTVLIEADINELTYKKSYVPKQSIVKLCITRNRTIYRSNINNPSVLAYKQHTTERIKDFCIYATKKLSNTAYDMISENYVRSFHSYEASILRKKQRTGIILS